MDQRICMRLDSLMLPQRSPNTFVDTRYYSLSFTWLLGMISSLRQRCRILRIISRLSCDCFLDLVPLLKNSLRCSSLKEFFLLAFTHSLSYYNLSARSAKRRGSLAKSVFSKVTQCYMRYLPIALGPFTFFLNMLQMSQNYCKIRFHFALSPMRFMLLGTIWPSLAMSSLALVESITSGMADQAISCSYSSAGSYGNSSCEVSSLRESS